MSTNDEKIKALSEEQTHKLLGMETFRVRVKEIIDEHTNNVEFMKKVREYAGMEIDSRLFTSAKFWLTTIISAAASALIGIIIGKFL